MISERVVFRLPKAARKLQKNGSPIQTRNDRHHEGSLNWSGDDKALGQLTDTGFQVIFCSMPIHGSILSHHTGLKGSLNQRIRTDLGEVCGIRPQNRRFHEGCCRGAQDLVQVLWLRLAKSRPPRPGAPNSMLRTSSTTRVSISQSTFLKHLQIGLYADRFNIYGVEIGIP